MEHRRGLALLLVGALLLSATAAGVSATPAKGKPTISVYTPSNELTPGQPNSLTLQIANSGEVAYASPGSSGAVTTARAAAVELRSDVDGIEIDTGEQAVGSIPSGGLAVADFRVVTGEDVAPGTYELTAAVTYEYTEIITDTGAQQEETAEKEFDVTVRVTDDARFEVIGLSSDVPVGQSGDVDVTVRNAGESTARDASVTLQSTSSAVSFGGTASATRYLGGVEANDTRTLTFDARVAPDAPTTAYPLLTTVDFEGSDGVPASDGPFRVAFTPLPERSVNLSAETVDLSVGSQGTVGLRVSNDGAGTLQDATVSFQPAGETVVPVETERVLGTLAPGESTTVDYPLQVAPGAEPGDRRLSFAVAYEDDGDDYRTSPVDVLASVSPRQSFAVGNATGDLAVGERGTASFTVTNDGSRTATDATVSLQPTGETVLPVEPEQVLGTLAPGESTTVDYPIRVAGTADSGLRQLSFVVAYDDDGTTYRSEPVSQRFDVAPKQSFTVSDATGDLAVGTRGTANFTVTNDGPQPVTDATVSLQPTGETVLPVEPEQVLGTLAPGESTTVQYPVRVAGTADSGPRQLSFVVAYDDDGDSYRSDPVNQRFDVAPEQSFDLTQVSDSLRVGQEGQLQGRVVNDGPGTARDAVLRLQPSGTTVQPQETEYALGTLAPGEAAAFRFPIDVTSSATDGPRQFSLSVAYDTDDGTAAESDPLNARVDVAPSRDEFSLGAEGTNLTAGDDGTVTLELTNNRNVTLRNVNAKAFVDAPLSADTDEAYVPRIAPGETRTVSFDLSVESGAKARDYPLELDFQYDEPDGDTKLSDTYQVPVEVRASSGGGGLLSTYGLPLGILSLLALAGAGVVYTRR